MISAVPRKTFSQNFWLDGVSAMHYQIKICYIVHKNLGPRERERERAYLYKCTKDPTPISEKTGITPSAIFI